MRHSFMFSHKNKKKVVYFLTCTKHEDQSPSMLCYRRRRRSLMDYSGTGKKKASISLPRSGIQYEWKAGNVTSAPFILPSSSHKLVIDCATHPINSPTIWHYGFEISCESAILRPPPLSLSAFPCLSSFPFYCYNVPP